MTRTPALLAAALCAFCAGCAGLPPQTAAPTPRPSALAAPPSDPVYAYRSDNRLYFRILDYQDKAQGAAIPWWLDLFFEKGVRAVEAAMPGRYVFIASNGGSNFGALSLWAEFFSPEQDFARLAARRIETRFARASADPGREFGPYFEALVRAASDADWRGAAEAGRFWLRRRFVDSGGADTDRETWNYYILLTIGKVEFAAQVEAILAGVPGAVLAAAAGNEGESAARRPSREQRGQLSAFSRACRRFFDGF
jgi:hypothetical protein